MTFFGAQNLFSIIIISFLLLLSGFSLFLPLSKILKSIPLGLKLTIPISFSIEIIFGYIFYDLKLVHFFPLTYVLLLFFINLYYWKKLNYTLFSLTSILKRTLKNKNYLFYFIFLIPILFTRFYDAIINIAPGNNDTFNHFIFLKDLSTIGFLSNPYYAPGFHLLLYPISLFVPFEDMYRFTGPVLGVMTVLSIFLLFKENFKNNLSKIFLIILFAFPLFNQLTLQTISFFSSALSFIFVASFIYLISKPKELNEKMILLFYLIISTALAITIPYLYVQLIPVVFILLLVAFYFKNIFKAHYNIFVVKIFAITIIGFFISFGHVYLQTNILHPGLSFPEINIVNNDGSTGSNYQNISTQIPSFFFNNPFIERYFLPMFNISYDILKIKNIRPANTILGLGAYIWTIISFVLLFFSIKRKKSLLLSLSIFSIIFGISTQTGILEMSYYRGRTGWYLLLFALLGTVFIFNEFYQDKFKKFVTIFFSIIFLSTFLSPPIFYRGYFTDTFAIANRIKNEFQNEKITFITTQYQLPILSKNFSTLPLYASSLKNHSSTQFLIFDNKFFNTDPILSQSAASTDKNFSVFNNAQQSSKAQLEKNISEIENNPKFANYKPFFSNENITVFILK